MVLSQAAHFANELTYRIARGREYPTRNVSLYKIDHLSLPANEDLCATIDRCRGDQRSSFSERWNVPVGPDVSFQAPRFHIEIAHTSIGIHNEHFLHHRRSGSCHLCCKLLGSAC